MNRSRPINGCALLVVLTSTLSCISTTGVTSPATVFAGSSFEIEITAVVEDDGEAWGLLGIVVPSGWEASNVSYNGLFQGVMVPDSAFGDFECAPWDHWIGFRSDSIRTGSTGDVYHYFATIHTDMLIGDVDISCLAAILNDLTPEWDGDPCSVSVEVVELNLNQSSWGGIKTEFTESR